MIVDESGKVPIKSWCNNPDQGVIDQAKNLASLPFVFKHVALMPDTHRGYGCPIGGVLATRNVVIPNCVGSDIGCGMSAVQLSLKTDDISTTQLKTILGEIRKVIPVGRNHHKQAQKEYLMPSVHKLVSVFGDVRNSIVGKEYQSALKQLGTLGSGNHFLEIQKGSDGHIWIMIHSGSRNLGYKVAKHYNKLAQELCAKWHSNIPEYKGQDGLAFFPLNSDEGIQYMAEMNYCLDFAFANRKLMMHKILVCFEDVLGLNCDRDNWYGINSMLENMINIHHNYARLENHFGQNVVVHRKGATSAKEGQIGIIPGSQGTASYIVKGKGNTDSFKSCFPGNTNVLTDNGLIPIKDICFNTKKYKIFSYNHKKECFEFAKIIDKSQYIGNTKEYNIFQRNVRKNNTISSTEGHPFATFEKSKFKYKNIEKIKKDKQPIISPFIIDNLNKIQPHNDNFYYLLGTILSDGSIFINDHIKSSTYKGKQYYNKAKYVRFSQANTQKKQTYINHVVDVFKEFFKTVYFYKHKGRTINFIKQNRLIHGKDYITITGKDDSFVDMIVQYLEKNLYVDIFSNKNIALNFLAGFLDGDGTVTNTKISISIGKIENIKYLIACFMKLGIVYKVYPNRKNYVIEFYDIDILQKLKTLCKRIDFKKIKQMNVYSEKNIFANSIDNFDNKGYINRKAKLNNLIGFNKIDYNINKQFTHNRVSETNINKTENVFNFTLDKNNNYIVFTENFTPILVHNCSHGAGRTMSRTKAKAELNLEEEIKKLDDQGIIHSIRNVSDLDEATSAYKNISEVINSQLDLIVPIVKLQPLAVVKG